MDHGTIILTTTILRGLPEIGKDTLNFEMNVLMLP